MSEEKRIDDDTDEMRPAGEDGRIAEAREETKRIDEDIDPQEGDHPQEGDADSPLAEDPGSEDTGAQS